MITADSDASTRDGWCDRILDASGRSHFVSLSGTRIHYLAWNEAARDRPILLLVHGFRGHAHWWDTVAPFLATDYRVFAMDFAGMGDSERRPVYRHADWSDDVNAFVEQVCREPVAVIAHSFGGLRTAESCMKRPDLYRRAIIVDSRFQLGEPLHFELPRKTSQVYPDLETALQHFRLMPEQPVWISEIRRHVGVHSLREVPGGWTWKFDPNTGSTVPTGMRDAEVLANVRVPTYFMYGEHSPLFTPDVPRDIVAALPHGIGPIVIPDAHHHVMLDRPLALVSALRAALADLNAR